MLLNEYTADELRKELRRRGLVARRYKKQNASRLRERRLALQHAKVLRQFATEHSPECPDRPNTCAKCLLAKIIQTGQNEHYTFELIPRYIPEEKYGGHGEPA